MIAAAVVMGVSFLVLAAYALGFLMAKKIAFVQMIALFLAAAAIGMLAAMWLLVRFGQ